MKEWQIKSNIDLNTQTLTIEVNSGQRDIKVRLAELPTNILIHAGLHGLKQKIMDAAALGAGSTVQEKHLAMEEVVARLTHPTEPSWNKRTSGASATGLLFRALCRAYPDKAPDALKGFYDKLTKSEQFALRKNPKIASIIEEIKAESTDTSGIDSNSLLDGLEGL